MGDEAKRRNVVIRTHLADGLSPVLGDRVQLQEVLLNLVINAMDAMGSVEDRARQLAIAMQNIDRDRVKVTVEDSGTGLDSNTTAPIFEPFYTTKSAGMGWGFRSAVPSFRTMAAGFGPRPITGQAQASTSPFRVTGEKAKMRESRPSDSRSSTKV